ALPALGSVNGFTGRRNDKDTFFSFTSFTYPSTVFRLDPATATATVFKKPSVDFDPASFETKRVFYPSKDGTKVPMFLVAKKGTKWDGTNPTMLFAYGGFNIPMLPSFSVKNLAFVERGGVYAQACLRGGSEYGDEWHKAGMLEKKQNVFDDFAAAARWLIANKVTSAKKLAIAGGSNGGLLVGATLNQHPELFGAALPAVGVMDMLRFQKFTIGWAWTSEYGSADNPDQFKFIYPYSPLHNIRKGFAYPPVLVTTADHDDRVVPAHSFKYAATLQEAQAGDAPVLIRIETRAGHGAGKPTTKLIEEATDQLAFLAKSLGGGPKGHGRPPRLLAGDADARRALVEMRVPGVHEKGDGCVVVLAGRAEAPGVAHDHRPLVRGRFDDLHRGLRPVAPLPVIVEREPLRVGHGEVDGRGVDDLDRAAAAGVLASVRGDVNGAERVFFSVRGPARRERHDRDTREAVPDCSFHSPNLLLSFFEIREILSRTSPIRARRIPARFP